MMKRMLSLALVSAMVLTLPACGGEETPKTPDTQTDSYTVAKASYPEQIPYPDPAKYADEEMLYEAWQIWREQERGLREFAVDASVLEHFLSVSIPEFLSGTAGNEVYSPLNVYIAMAMLAELTDGNSRSQILEVLGADSIGQLRQDVSAVWNGVYRDDGTVTSVLANSLWLDEDITYVQETMNTLAEQYFASSYSGEMGSEALNQALQEWINEQTGGLLEEQASELKLDRQTILTLASTIYFRAKWSNEFNPERTTDGEFVILSPDGGTIPCEFMHSSETGVYYWSDRFSAVGKDLENGGKMWFILPDYPNGAHVREVLEDPATMEFLLADGEWENQKRLVINLAVPKFDVSNKVNLIRGMKNLGITDVFDPDVSDFTPTTTQFENIFLSQAEHTARVTIDEEGVTAAAYTVMMEAGAAMPPAEEVDFILDKPFLFVITADGGLPLFMGTVVKPE